jgi:sugar lactone lactonase YvrE
MPLYHPQIVPHTPIAALGEGPVWLPDERQLCWLDIEGCRLFRLTFGDDTVPVCNHLELPNKVGCFVPTTTRGQFLLATQNGITVFQLPRDDNASQTKMLPLRVLTHPESDKADNRYNDGKCSPDGRFWFGSLSMVRKQNNASLYALERCGSDETFTARTVISGATNSNGLGWSPDCSTFYWIDTPTRQVAAFDYNAINGTLSNKRIAVQFPADESFGRPDGMTVDSEGMIWVAHWLGGRVTRWNPMTSELIMTIPLPVARVTSLTFGGNDLRTLYVTTARKGMTSEEIANEKNQCGCLFEIETEIQGLPVNRIVV